MRTRTAVVAGVCAAILFVALIAVFRSRPDTASIGPHAGQSGVALKRVVINEAARTLLYLPLYHAVEQGFFRDAGLEVDIITGGTATNSFASMLSGEADFALADPMYVPISREKGSQTKVVAQVVGRIAFWGLAKDPAISEINTNTLKGKTIATHPRPMSGYTYTIALIRMLALTPDGDVQIIESQPGTELAPLFNAQAAFVLTVEPNVSKAVAQGAHVVFSYPDALGDQILSALMTREDYITANRKLVLDVVSAIQRALTDIHHDIERALASARNRFPQLDEETLRQAVNRLVSERVIPTSISVSEDSWDRAIRVRIDAGDLRAPSPRSENCAVAIMEDGSKLHD